MSFVRGETPEGVRAVHALARLKPGVTTAEAKANVRPILQDLARTQPGDFPKQWRVDLPDLQGEFSERHFERAVDPVRGGGAAAADCVRERVEPAALEGGVPTAGDRDPRGDGGGRGRLMAQLLSESLLLGLGGGALGVAVGAAGLRGIIAMVPPNTIPDEAQIVMNGPVLLFAVAVSVGAALLFGTVPALQMSRGDLIDPLKEDGGGARERGGSGCCAGAWWWARWRFR